MEKSSGGTTLNQATYTYDALGHRIGIDDNGSQTWIVYDGSDADANPYADFNGSGTLLTRYVSGLAVDELFARTSSGGTTAWYLMDRLGSVRDIVNTSGTVIDHIVYDSYGNIVTETNATNGDRFKFTGMEYDTTTGQYYDHARDYDSATGRFMSQDPMGYAAGDSDLYRYVGNDPFDHTDPTGRDWLDNASNTSAGWADTITFSLTYWYRYWRGLDGFIDTNSWWYFGGSMAGMIHSVAMGALRGSGLQPGMRLANPAFQRGYETVQHSHWIGDWTKNLGVPGWIRGASWNLQKMWQGQHARIDPGAYRFVKLQYKNLPQYRMHSWPVRMFWRTPGPIQGSVGGVIYYGLSSVANRASHSIRGGMNGP